MDHSPHGPGGSPVGGGVPGHALTYAQAHSNGHANSLSIRQEIQRFESVHPSIYAIYDLIELIPDPLLAQQIREHVVCIEDSFVNSQEWTLSRGVPDIRLGIVGSLSSGKSALVHRYLTGSYMQEESPEGGRFKKEVMVDGLSYLLLIRDEGGPPEQQFSTWVDAVIFVFSLENETSFNAIWNYYTKMSQYRNMADIPLILVGTQDSISETHPRLIDDLRARKLANDLKKCAYYETCATYGLNVERVFQEACQKITTSRFLPRPATPSHHGAGSHPSGGASSGANSTSMMTSRSTLNTFPSPTTSNGFGFGPGGNHGIPSPTQSPGGMDRTHQKEFRHSLDSFRSAHHVFNNSHSPNATHAQLSPSATASAVVASATASVMASTDLESAKFAVPHDKAASGGAGGNSHFNNNVENKENNSLTPTSTPTAARKNRRRSNLFTPSKKSSGGAVGSGSISGSGGGSGNNLDEKFLNGTGQTPQMGSGRSIPIRQGYLYKKSNKSFSKEWKKKYVTLGGEGKITYHPSLHDYMENHHGKEIPLGMITVKVPGQKPRGSRTVNQPPGPGGNSGGNNSVVGGPSDSGIPTGSNFGKSDKKSEKVLLTGYELIRDPSGGEEGENANAGSASEKMNAETPNVKKRHRRMKSNGVKTNADIEDPDLFEFHIVSLDNKQWFFEAASSEERDEWVEAIEQQILSSLQGNESSKKGSNGNHAMDLQVIKSIRNGIPGNNKCVDCDAPNPDWASINLGVLMCIECSGVHRQLGSHISRVRSLDLDEWPQGHLAAMMAVGNLVANEMWEARLHKGHKKPSPGSSQSDKEQFILAKYRKRDFLASIPNGQSPAAYLVDGILRSDVKEVCLALAHASQSDVNAPLSPPLDTRTPLHLTAAQGNLAIAQLLIWSNATVTSIDNEGRSPMHFARNSGNKELAELLLNNGCPDVSLNSFGQGQGQIQGHGTLPRARRNSLTRQQMEQQQQQHHTNSALL